MTLTANNVHETFIACLFGDGEPTESAVIVEGICGKFGFDPVRLEKHKQAIGEMLSMLPDGFKVNKGGGMSFLNACVTADGTHWGEHRSMEQLFALGLATGHATLCLPRQMWEALPGGMPYYSIDTETNTARVVPA